MKNLTKTTLISLATVTALSLGAWATCSDNVDMGEHKIVNVADPENDKDVVNKKYLIEMLVKNRKALTRMDEIVIDEIAELQWQDNSPVADENKKLSWLESKDYCENLVLGNNYTDWRVPTFDELKSLFNVDFPSKISAIFRNVSSDYYWSSTTNTSNSSLARGIDFSYGGYYWNDKENKHYVRCVRGGE